MKKVRNMKTYLTPTAAAVALALTAGSAHALDVYLAAKPFTKTMPDGSMIPMWGYVEDTGGDCYALAGIDRDECVDVLGEPTLPGPRITVPPTDGGALTIHLMNYLPEPTSIVIPGQGLPLPAGPTWDDGTTGGRTSPEQRVRSFGAEAAANGGAESYSWALARSGSFIYHSGTHPQKQVYMGLYGAVTQDADAGEVFDGVPYDNEIVLFYSDIDPALNAAIEDGSYTTSIDLHARWHLVNGEPYEDGVTPDLEAWFGNTNLVRFFSAASETVVPVFQGRHLDIHAEDGFRYNWQAAGGTENYVPRTQYSVKLPPLKTKDAILASPALGRFAVYEAGGNMTNPTNPNDFDVEDAIGGMLRFVDVPNTAPVIDPILLDQLNTENDSVSLPIAVVDPDVTDRGDVLTFGAVGLPLGLTIDPDTGEISGTVSYGAFEGAPGGVYATTVTVTDLADASDSASFDWTITNLNQVPVFDGPIADQISDEGAVVAGPTVAATDPDGDGLTYSAAGLPPDLSINSATGQITGTVSYDAAATSPYTVAVTVSDGTDSADTSFAWTINDVNRAPVISPDTVADQMSTVGIAITGLQFTATDPDGDTPLTYGATGLPTGLGIDATTGLIAGTPSEAQGVTQVTVTVSDRDPSDPDGLSDSVTFNWTVNPGAVNNPPVVTSPGPQSSVEGDTISLQIEATDPEGGPLSFELDAASSLPAGLTISTDGLISGTIATGAVSSSPYSVTVNVSDGTNTVPVDFNWTVTEAVTNAAPVVTSPGPQSSVEGDTISLQIEATDPEGGPLSFELDAASSLPAGLTISTDGLISGTIATGAVSSGPYSVTVNVSDGTNTVPVTFNWTVTEAVTNAAPVVTSPGPQSSVEGDTISLQIEATDPEGGPLSFELDAASSLPAGLTISTDGLISGTIATGAVSSGPYSVTVNVSDGTNTVPVTFGWTVTEVVVPAGPDLYFSTLGGWNANPVPDVDPPYDDADVYTLSLAAGAPPTSGTFGRAVDARPGIGLPGVADIDGLHYVNENRFYVSFNRNGGTDVPGLGLVQDEDVVLYDAGTDTWTLYFDGSNTCGLGTSNGQDIDALSVDETTGMLYFSTIGGGNAASNLVGGVSGPYDDADIYTWNGANCERVFDARSRGALLLPGNADIDGLTVKDGVYYMSFNRNDGAGGTVIEGFGTVGDEDVVSYDGTTWSWYVDFDGAVGPLTNNGQDIDAIHVP